MKGTRGKVKIDEEKEFRTILKNSFRILWSRVLDFETEYVTYVMDEQNKKKPPQSV